MLGLNLVVFYTVNGCAPCNACADGDGPLDGGCARTRACPCVDRARSSALALRGACPVSCVVRARGRSPGESPLGHGAPQRPRPSLTGAYTVLSIRGSRGVEPRAEPECRERSSTTVKMNRPGPGEMTSCNLRRAAAPRAGVVAGTFMCARSPDGGVAL